MKHTKHTIQLSLILIAIPIFALSGQWLSARGQAAEPNTTPAQSLLVVDNNVNNDVNDDEPENPWADWPGPPQADFEEDITHLRTLMDRASASVSAAAISAQSRETSGGFEPFSFVNFETPHVSPLDLTPDGNRLLAVNIADNSLMVFDISAALPVLTKVIPVGLDPASVRARTNGEAWVVNHISDSISVVDLDAGVVTATLLTSDEPTDVVFAGTPPRAFVTASQVNQVNVFDLSNLNAAPTIITIRGEDPRMLQVSPDGETVYAAIFESGNGTTLVAGGKDIDIKVLDVVRHPDGPYGGMNVPPNDGTSYDPPLNPDNPAPVAMSMIVRKADNGSWLDDNSGDWTDFVSGERSALSNRVAGWDLPDRDIAIIDANSLAVTYQTRLMNMVMAMDVNPVTGQLLVVGTEATNEIRWKPNINGTFVRVQMALFQPRGTATIQDLNPHLDYATRNIPQSDRDQSIGDPRGVAWTADGSRAYITGMGSNNVAVLDVSGTRITRIEVGEGPTGIVIKDSASLAYVMNKFDGSISVIDINGQSEIERIPFHDPTLAAIKTGRPHLYDTHATSGLGQISCASCHVDARTDRLAWDLGDPAGEMNTRVAADGNEYIFHPLKGPMKTQTLQDIIGAPAMHHIGDKEELADFAEAFEDLQADDAPMDDASMAEFEAMLDTVHYPPNSFRNIDNSFSTSVAIPGPNGSVYAVGDAEAGRLSFLTGEGTSNRCTDCHNTANTRTDIVKAPNNGFINAQPLISENLRGLYDRVGMWRTSADGSTSGFGILPDGSQSSEIIALGRPFPMNSQNGPHVHAFMLSIEGPLDGLPGLARDSHAGAGQQITLDASAVTADLNRLNELMDIADTGNVGMVVQGRFDGETRGFTYLGSNQFQSDRIQQIVTRQALIDAAGDGPLTFTIVPSGSQYRIGIDRDEDGQLDGNERDANRTPHDPTDAEWAECASQGQSCSFSGKAAVRFGADGQFLYGVFEDGVICSTNFFGDNGLLGTKSCAVSTPIIEPSACGPLQQEAENGSPFGDFEIANDGNANGGQYIYVPENSAGDEWDGPNSNRRVDYCFTVAEAGDYAISGMVYGTDTESDSFYVKVNDAPANGYLWAASPDLYNSWVLDYANDRDSDTDPLVFPLAAGEHTVSIFLREDGTRLDTIALEPFEAQSILGNVDCDNELDAVDALFVLQYSVDLRDDYGRCPLADTQTQLHAAAGDMNGNGVTDAVDALFILQCAVGLQNGYCPVVRAAAMMDAEEAAAAEEVKQILLEEGLWMEQDISIFVPLISR